jgi:hypothetical protein
MMSSSLFLSLNSPSSRVASHSLLAARQPLVDVRRYDSLQTQVNGNNEPHCNRKNPIRIL